ncbi:MAG TPA: DUF6473 family protein [Paracoccaceae bacterium]|nr:DUF6473 family protein [Paracoccaceae bacterium]
MAYAYAGEGPLDYFPCRYGASRHVFRGPARDLALPFVAAMGGTETYGRFIPEPWPALVEAATGFRMVNLGLPHAGPDAFLADPGVMAVVARARAVVLQCPGAANLSNPFYAVHPRRNDRFLRALPPLVQLFPEVDFTHFHFTGHLLATLRGLSPQRFGTLAAGLRATWVARMQALVAAPGVPVVLLWMGDAPPGGERGQDGVAVTAAMLAQVSEGAARRVEVVFSPDALSEGCAGMAFAPMDRPAAEGLPGPAAHREVAAAVTRALETLL